MSIVTIANEAEALNKIWDSLTGCSIAWEIENLDLPECEMILCAQTSGTRKGTWDNIPTKSCEECGTQHDGIFSSNFGGVAYYVPGPPSTPNCQGIYFGIFWGDPMVGASHYGITSGWGDPNGKKWVETVLKDNWNTGGNTHISGTPSSSFVQNGIKVEIQPGFDPFKITFSRATQGDTVDKIHHSVHYLDTPEKLAAKYEAQGKAFIEHSKFVRDIPSQR